MQPVGNIGVMFLDEVVLGDEYFYDLDKLVPRLVPNPGMLTKAPDGYDSVVYLGSQTKPGCARGLY